MFVFPEGPRSRPGAACGFLIALALLAAGCGPSGARHVQAMSGKADADSEEGGTGGGTPTGGSGGSRVMDASPDTGGSPGSGGVFGDTGGSGGSTGGSPGTGGSTTLPDAAPDLAADLGAPDTAPDAPQTCVSGMAGAFMNTPMTSQTGTFTAHFSASVSTAPSNGIVALSMGAQTGFAGYAASVRFNPMGMIDAVNGAAYDAASSIPYTANTTYQFRMAINVTAHTYSVFVTAPDGKETMVGSGYAFRTGQTSLNRLDSWAVAMQSMASGTLKACGFVLE